MTKVELVEKICKLRPKYWLKRGRLYSKRKSVLEKALAKIEAKKQQKIADINCKK